MTARRAASLWRGRLVAAKDTLFAAGNHPGLFICLIRGQDTHLQDLSTYFSHRLRKSQDAKYAKWPRMNKTTWGRARYLPGNGNLISLA
jgi:hypothetical protein